MLRAMESPTPKPPSAGQSASLSPPRPAAYRHCCTAGGTGTAAVTTPDTSADTADTHQTSDSHAALYITLGTVAVLGAAAAMVVVVLRKQKKA